MPVLQGAGVKFKTVEALFHGVPTVTTTVGAEGVGSSELFAALTDSASSLSAALIHVLEDPANAQPAADRAQEWASSEFSLTAFRSAVAQAWRR